jgi:hypothetical protein
MAASSAVMPSFIVHLLFILALAHISTSKRICHLDAVLCLDNTYSIKAVNWQFVLEFGKSLINEMLIGPDETHIGLVDFGYRGYLRFDLNAYTDQSAAAEHLGSLKYLGERTNTTGGLYVSRRILTEPQYGPRGGDIPKIIVLVTDGNPNEQVETLEDEVRNIRQAGIRIVVVGITKAVNEAIMRGIASTPDDYIYAEDFKSLSSVKERILNDRTCDPITTLPPTTTEEPTTAVPPTEPPTTTERNTEPPTTTEPPTEPPTTTEPPTEFPTEPQTTGATSPCQTASTTPEPLVCTFKWTSYPRSHVIGLVYQWRIYTESDCMEVCQRTSNCWSIDFNNLRKSCWFGTSEIPKARIPDLKVTHKDLERTCVSASQVTTTEPTPRCHLHWTQYARKQVKDLTLRPDIHTEKDCKAACEETPDCLNVDFNHQEESCWFGTAQDPREMVPDDTVTHWNLVRICDNNVTNTPIPTPPTTAAPTGPPTAPPTLSSFAPMRSGLA